LTGPRADRHKQQGPIDGFAIMKALSAALASAGFPVSKLERETLHDRAYLELKRAIMSGAIRPGATITIRAMATALGTSPMPVREALRRLVAERALDMLPTRSVTLPVITPDRFDEICRIRVTLEGLVTETAAGLIRAGELQQMQQANAEMWRLKRQQTAVYLAKKQYDEAEAEFRTALRIDPAAPQALAGMASVQEGRGNLDDALEYLQRIVRQESGSSYPTVMRIAGLFIRMGKPVDGAAYLKGLEPSFSRSQAQELALRIALGMLYTAAGRPADAEAALRRALVLDPTSVPAMGEVFALYDGQGRTAEMKPMIQAALRKNPDSAMHHVWLGLVLRREYDLKGAEAELKRAVQASPDLVGALANLGSLYLQEGRADDAVTVLQQALRKDARNPESRTNLIVALGMKRDLEGARRLVKDAEGMGQRVPPFYNALAYALHVNGRNEEALETLRESLRINPRQPDALRLRSEIETGGQAGDLPYR